MKLSSVHASYVWTYALWETTSSVAQGYWSPDKWLHLRPMHMNICYRRKTYARKRLKGWFDMEKKKKKVCIVHFLTFESMHEWLSDRDNGRFR